MKIKIIAAVVAAILSVFVLAGFTVHGPPSAGTYSPTAPKPPAGYTQTYAHNFVNQGMGDWVTQPGAGAKVSVSTSYGLGVEVTAENQWAEVISKNAVIKPNTFVQALVYIPSGPHGYTANWPAFWTTGQNWPADGEIDILEGQSGRSCEQTHYGTHGEVSSASNCGPLGSASTGWLTVSMLRTGQQVKVWYGSTLVGTVPLPTTANEELIFQNQSYSTSVCGNCFGPLVIPTTAWLSRVTVYAP
jgi:hypothetical protein